MFVLHISRIEKGITRIFFNWFSDLISYHIAIDIRLLTNIDLLINPNLYNQFSKMYK